MRVDTSFATYAETLGDVDLSTLRFRTLKGFKEPTELTGYLCLATPNGLISVDKNGVETENPTTMTVTPLVGTVTVATALTKKNSPLGCRTLLAYSLAAPVDEYDPHVGRKIARDRLLNKENFNLRVNENGNFTHKHLFRAVIVDADKRAENQPMMDAVLEFLFSDLPKVQKFTSLNGHNVTNRKTV